MSSDFPRYWTECGVDASPDISCTRFKTSRNDDLFVYEMGAGNARTMVLVNPVATPFLYLFPLATLLSREFHVLSVENRDGPFLSHESAVPAPDVREAALDIAEYLAHRGIARAHVLSWCSGVSVALALWPNSLDFLSFICIAPVGVVPKIKHRLRSSSFDLLLRLVQEDAEKLNSLRAKRSTLIEKLNAMPLSSVETLKAYSVAFHQLEKNAEQLRCFRSFDEVATRVPCLLVHSEDDLVADPARTVSAAQRNKKVQLKTYEEGGHYLATRQAAVVAQDIIQFIYRSTGV